MGLYAIDCPQCGLPHMWFSGNLDQRCAICRDAPAKLTPEERKAWDDEFAQAAAQSQSDAGADPSV